MVDGTSVVSSGSLGVTYVVADNVTYRVAFMMRPTWTCAPASKGGGESCSVAVHDLI